MNKQFLIVLLAVCLVSVHAFVKRDAPEAPKPNGFEDLQKKLEEFGSSIGGKVKQAFDPDAIKNSFNDFAKNINKAWDDLKQKKQD